MPDVPVAVLTNSSLLPDPAVRKRLAGADVVLPSMDTLVPAEFVALNRRIRRCPWRTSAGGCSISVPVSQAGCTWRSWWPRGSTIPRKTSPGSGIFAGNSGPTGWTWSP
jgi:hypothetical protein